MVRSSVSLYSVFILILLFSLPLRVEPEDRLHFKALANKYGLNCEEHDVVTQDGYILSLFRIPGDRTRPVLLMHGILDSADTFMIRGNTSMVAVLANTGYDVWVGNERGNRYSRRHVTLDPNNDKQFWDFSFHEMGMYDLPAFIDYILYRTGQSKLSCIGHSQGNTIFYVLGSMRPEYNDKIRLMIALAPICYLYHLPEPAKSIVQAWPVISDFLTAVGHEEVFGHNSIERKIVKSLCRRKDSYELCGKGILMNIAGNDPEELEPEFLTTVVAYYPSSTSRKCGTHLLQMGLKKDFSQIDYGAMGNLAAYNSVTPPNYDLGKVTMKIALLVASNDKMNSLTDVKILRRRLPNVVDYYVISWSKFNHADYVWGRNMAKHLFPKVFSLLELFGKD